MPNCCRLPNIRGLSNQQTSHAATTKCAPLGGGPWISFIPSRSMFTIDWNRNHSFSYPDPNRPNVIARTTCRLTAWCLPPNSARIPAVYHQTGRLHLRPLSRVYHAAASHFSLHLESF